MESKGNHGQGKNKIEFMKNLALKKWAYLDEINKKDPTITDILYSSANGTWDAGLWIDKERPNIVRYKYIFKKGRYAGKTITQGYFAV